VADFANPDNVSATDPSRSQSALFENSYLKLKQCRHGAMLFFATDIYLGRSLDLYGEFSEGEIRLFDQIIHPGMTIVDVGANIGAHTIFFAKKTGSAGRVFAMEPQRVLYHVLCGNIALNLHHNVTAINAGMGATATRLPVPRINYARGGNFGGLPLGQWAGEDIPVVPLDSYRLEPCHLIKIDVEGMERDVLEGARATLARNRPFLYVENDRSEKSKALIDWLFNADYRLFWHLPLLFNQDNYFGRQENVFGNIRSINILGVPRSKQMTFTNFREITSADDDWRSPPQ
jgi:FkbM family methyltransferase